MKKEYLHTKIDELETNNKIENIRDFYRGISDFKKLNQPRTNIPNAFWLAGGTFL